MGKQKDCYGCEKRFIGCHACCPLGLYKPNEDKYNAQKEVVISYFVDKYRRNALKYNL